MAISQMAKASEIKIENAYARASIGVVRTGVVYLTLENGADEPDRLRKASTDIAGRAEFHLHTMNEDVMTMDEVKCLTIPARGKIAFAPGGLNVMLLDLSSPLKEGGEFALRLTFDRAGEISVNVPVKSAAAGFQQPHAHTSLQFCD